MLYMYIYIWVLHIFYIFFGMPACRYYNMAVNNSTHDCFFKPHRSLMCDWWQPRPPPLSGPHHLRGAPGQRRIHHCVCPAGASQEGGAPWLYSGHATHADQVIHEHYTSRARKRVLEMYSDDFRRYNYSPRFPAVIMQHAPAGEHCGCSK